MKHVLSLSTLFPNAVNPSFGTFVARSLEALAKRGEWRVTMINPIGTPPLAVGRYRALSKLGQYSEENGLAVHRPRFTLVPKVGARRNAGAIFKAALPAVERIHAQYPIDLIDAQFFYPDGPAAARIADALDIPLSIKARGSDITFWGTRDYAREQILDAATRADGLLAVSADLAGRMAELGMERDKITIHYTGLDRDRFRPLNYDGLRPKLAAQLGFDLPISAPLLVTVGALIERKGQAKAVSALSSLPEARLILVGKGEDEPKLRDLTGQLGVRDRVHFAGSLDHDVLPLVLSAADAMVLPTANEGLANAWVEALACGTRVITSDVGGARELITNDRAGYLVDRTPEAISDAVKTLLAKPVSRQEVAETVEYFSWRTNAAELAAHFERLLG